ncbi:hypothetical protein GCM10010507_63260 [Streptomyces cinnamoneus]|uniref:Uncharacterized protein n=1 Tax=Streptomyces cinnamoneus TaxID=53446 RepID=A0A918WRT0_STRCJ|nr:hypothetical protein GCM10010507_63260 [Streptomyces cinnamoneus]
MSASARTRPLPAARRTADPFDHSYDAPFHSSPLHSICQATILIASLRAL